MSARSIKKSVSTTASRPEPQIFAVCNSIKKRKIYYNVDYSEEEYTWINNVRRTLKEQKGIEIKQDPVLLRYYYCADLNMEKCLDKLTEYHKWFTNPSIQCLTNQTYEVFKDGFTYTYGKARNGKAFIIMNIYVLDTDKHNADSYMQAINQVLNYVIKEEFIPGYIENYYYIIDLNEQLLSLPISSLGDMIKVIGNAYAGNLDKLLILNCTMMSKWIYNRLCGFGVISQQTAGRILFFTKDQIEEGALRQFIDENVLEQKYGGLRQDIDHRLKEYKRPVQNAPQIQVVDELTQTEYFSIEQNQQFQYYKQGVCCGDNDECVIF